MEQLEKANQDKTSLLSFYCTMQLIRQCEEQLARSHQLGLVHGACHTYDRSLNIDIPHYLQERKIRTR